jgi:peptidoglycan/xylan/chitin deacetylase (PgdA/CDA1 family)
MRAHPYVFRSTSYFKMVFLLISGALLAVIVIGSIYVENEPALSPRAIFADVRGAYLSAIWSPYQNLAVASTANAKAIPVLTYHRLVRDVNDVANVTVANFQDQMLALKKAGWQSVSLQEFEEFIEGRRTLPEKSFLLTFDDAAKDSFYPVDPILKALGFHATNFVIVASSEIPRSTYYLVPKEIERMIASGRWSIGSHSFDGHRPYPADPAGQTGVYFADRLWLSEQSRLETVSEFSARVRQDLAAAKKDLETTYNVPIRSFAFPLGNETGVNGANNFPEGASTTEAIARSLYKFGFLQLNNQHFTFAFPTREALPGDIASMTAHLLGTDFIVRRIHVDHDWDGERLLSIMENGRMKTLPYEDDFSENRGWIPAWGALSIGRNNFELKATDSHSSASAFLDGSALWDDYGFDLTANWQSGHIFALADVIDSSTYDACVYSRGEVRIQSTVRGQTRTLVAKKVPAIAYSDSARLGIRVHGATIECTWDYASVLESYERKHAGGVGVQVWNETLGVAEAQVSSVIVRPYFASNTPS